MIVEVGNHTKNRTRLINQGYTPVEIDGARNFDRTSAESHLNILQHFNPKIRYRVLLKEKGIYELYGLHQLEEKLK